MEPIAKFTALFRAGIATRNEVRKVYTDQWNHTRNDTVAMLVVDLVPDVFTVAEAREFLGLEKLPPPPPPPQLSAQKVMRNVGTTTEYHDSQQAPFEKPRKAKKAPAAA